MTSVRGIRYHLGRLYGLTLPVAAKQIIQISFGFSFGSVFCSDLETFKLFSIASFVKLNITIENDICLTIPEITTVILCFTLRRSYKCIHSQNKSN